MFISQYQLSILSLKVIECLSVRVSVRPCFCLSVRFFGMIDFKLLSKLPFGSLITKIFFYPLPLPPTEQGGKINFLGISITPKPFNGFSSKFLEGCYVGYCQKPSCKKLAFYLPPQQSNHATSLKIRQIWIFAFLCANSSQTA